MRLKVIVSDQLESWLAKGILTQDDFAVWTGDYVCWRDTEISYQNTVITFSRGGDTRKALMEKLTLFS